MFRIAVFILLLFLFAIGFTWLAENPGSVTVTWPWLGSAVEVPLMLAVVVLAAIVTLAMTAWWVISGILNSPQSFGRWRAGRRRDKGYKALSQGLVAAGAGNAPLARRLSKESGKLLENEPLVALLDAQTSLLEGDRMDARKKFETMLEEDETRLLGLRGLYLEAEQEGAADAAAHFAGEANQLTPGTPWAAQAVLKSQTVGSDWEGALKTLDQNRAAGLLTKEEYNRKKAVLLTARAVDEEDASPENAKMNALAAHKLAPDLVPAAVTAARACTRLGSDRKAAKVLEAAWKIEPHPELADAYVNLKSGDTAKDRLKRAESFSQKHPTHPESLFILAQAAIDAGEFKQARNAMEEALRTRPSERACLLMADIEEAEHGDKGRVREWLSRAVSAPKDAAWTADGVISENWAPYSPLTGALDAFEWKVPVEQLGGPASTADYSKLANQPLETEIEDIEVEEDTASMKTVSATVASATAAAATAEAANTNEPEDAIEDAEVVAVESPNSDDGEAKDENTPDGKDESIAAVSSNGDSPAADESKAADGETPKEPKNGKPGKDDASPYENANLDPDEDGVIDRRPDDPGIKEGVEPKKKGLFF